MEEKKLKQPAAMSIVKGKKNVQEHDDDSAKKLTYEQLNGACMQLYQQNQNLLKQLQQANMTNLFKRLDYLFQVLKYESVIKDPDFVSSCIEEIKEAMTVDAAPTSEKEDVKSQS